MQRKHISNGKKDMEFNNIIKDLVSNETVQKMKEYRQHGDTNCFEHCYLSAYYCYKISKLFKWDYRAAARGAMLHDLFLYDWREKQENLPGLHAFVHGKLACQNASQIFVLTEKEKDIIKNHMFPVTLELPKYKEGMLLTFIDKYCTVVEMTRYWYEEYAINIKNKICEYANYLLKI